MNKYQRFDQGPFIEDRLVCGINAIIEVLNLSVPKLNCTDRQKIKSILSELSSSNTDSYNSLISLSVKFQATFEIKCWDNAQLMEQVLSLTEEKFNHFLKNNEFI